MGSVIRMAVRGIRELGDHPLAQAFTLAAVTLSAFLAGLFLLLLHNIDRVVTEQRGEVTFQIYWQGKLPQDQVAKAWEELRQDPALKSLETFTPEQAFGELSKAFGGRGSLAPGRENPLPPTAKATFAVPKDDAAWAQGIRDRLRGIPGVTDVHYNPLQMDLATSWVRVSRGVVWPLIGLLGLVAGLIVGNTIKLAQISRLDEVDILRLVGATRAYIQLPMLSGGAFLCLVAGVLALLLLKGFQLVAHNALNVAPLFVTIEFLPMTQALGLFGALIGVGLVSSWVAVKE